MAKTQATRCTWVNSADPLMLEYHDREWGVPVHDDRTHFEFLVLEAAQAGLSWAIVLRKREGYRRAFSQFDPAKVARYTDTRIQKLIADPGIIRNRLKIESAVRNARAFLAVQEEFGQLRRLLLAVRRRAAPREPAEVDEGDPRYFAANQTPSART